MVCSASAAAPPFLPCSIAALRLPGFLSHGSLTPATAPLTHTPPMAQYSAFNPFIDQVVVSVQPRSAGSFFGDSWGWHSPSKSATCFAVTLCPAAPWAIAGSSDTLSPTRALWWLPFAATAVITHETQRKPAGLEQHAFRG